MLSCFNCVCFWKPHGLTPQFAGTDAPFDQEFYIILNVACGGVSNYFPDGPGARPSKLYRILCYFYIGCSQVFAAANGAERAEKPWSNDSPTSAADFYRAKDTWYPTWKGEDAAMQVSMSHRLRGYRSRVHSTSAGFRRSFPKHQILGLIDCCRSTGSRSGSESIAKK